MKLRRNAHMLGGILDAAPITSVFFLIVIFVMLGSLVYTPGIQVQLPVADNLPGTDKPTVTVAVDAGYRLYYANQMISEPALKARLAEVVAKSSEPPTLIVQADQSVTYGYLMRLALIARDAGIRDALLPTLPRSIGVPGGDGPAKQ